jgi:hypothetical protein
MKKLIIVIAFIAISAQSAFSFETIANYSFGIANHQVGGDGLLVNAELSDNKELTVTVYRPTPKRLPPTAPTKVVTILETKELGLLAYQNLLYKVISLSNAEITEKRNPIVCQIYPGPSMLNNHLKVARKFVRETKTFYGAPILVDGPKGCWVHLSVFPKQKYDQEAALELKAALKALALDMIKAEL